MTSKSQLNLFCQKSRMDVPCYTTERTQDGFVSSVTVGGRHHRSNMAHYTKKSAEDDAASAALEAILLDHPDCSSVSEMIEWADKHRGTRPYHGSPQVPIVQRISTTTTTGRSTMPSQQNPLPNGGSGTSPRAATGSTPELAVRKSNDQAMLEEFCSTRGIGEPEYHVCRKKPNLYTATVTIGDEVYTTEQEYEDFGTAKDCCTSLAIAALGIRDLKISDTGINPILLLSQYKELVAQRVYLCK